MYRERATEARKGCETFRQSFVLVIVLRSSPVREKLYAVALLSSREDKRFLKFKARVVYRADFPPLCLKRTTNPVERTGQNDDVLA